MSSTGGRPAAISALGCAALLAASLTLSACGVFGSDDTTTTVIEASPAGSETVAETTTTTESPTTVPATTATTTTPVAPTEPSVASGPEASAGETTTTVPATPTTPAPPLQMSLDGALGISRFFSDASPWNTSVQGDPVDPDSKRLLELARLRTAAVEEPDGTLRPIRRPIDIGLTVNVRRWTVPVFSERGGVETVAVCRQADCGPEQIETIVLPTDADPDPRFDGWMTVIDTAEGVARDFWRARREADGSISYHFVKAWELDGSGFQEPGGVSARGSGLPLFAGLIRPEEIKAGRIDHALAISVPGPARLKYVQPASRTDGNGRAASLPEGARLRLRPGMEKKLTKTFVRNAKQRQVAETIIDALERYGAIVVDRSAAPTMYAQRNVDWRGILPLNLLQDIGLEKFEVIELQRLRDVTRENVGSGFTDAGLPTDSASSVPATGSGTDASESAPATTTTVPQTEAP